MSNVEKFFWRWIQKNGVRVQKRGRSRFLDFAPSIKPDARTFMVVQLRPKKCPKKVCCTCKVVDARSRCHHRHLWWRARLPSNTDQSQHRQQLDEPTSRQKVPSAGETHEWKLRLGLVPFWLAQKVARDLWANYKAWHRSISATIFVEILLSRN